MLNPGKLVRRSMLLVFLIVFIASITGLFKNRAEAVDFINYSCFFLIALSAMEQGVVFGLLVTLVVMFSYVSYLMLYSIMSGSTIFFTFENAWWVVLFLLASFIIGLAGNKLKSIEKVFIDFKQELDELLLTGRAAKFASMHRFHQDLDYEIARSKRSKSTFVLIFLELTDLADIELRFGKEGQSKIIDAIGSALLRATRETDKKARVDENTFSLILPETPLDNIFIVTKKILDSLQNVNIEFKGKIVKYTPVIKLGFSAFPKDGDSSAALLEKARTSMPETAEKKE